MRVLVLTAPVGDGHVSAARTLADDIARLQPDATVTVVDALQELPRPLAWLLRDAYRWQLSTAPWLFALLFGALRHSRVLRAVSRRLLSLAGSRSILRATRGSGDVIVSTWPVATTILGCLRLRGKLRLPVCATITDFAGLELWADRGVDLHVVMHPALVGGVERLTGRGSVVAVAPLVGAEFLVPCDRGAARRALGLPSDRSGRPRLGRRLGRRRPRQRRPRGDRPRATRSSSASPGETSRTARDSSRRSATSRG